jgi:hypothetical protein
MSNPHNKRYVKWIGLGFLYIWMCAFVAWVDLWNSGNTLAEVIAFAGISLVTVSCISLAFYTTSLEEKVKALGTRLDVAKQNAAYWESQANLAFDKIESLTEMHTSRVDE